MYLCLWKRWKRLWAPRKVTWSGLHSIVTRALTKLCQRIQSLVVSAVVRRETNLEERPKLPNHRPGNPCPSYFYLLVATPSAIYALLMTSTSATANWKTSPHIFMRAEAYGTEKSTKSWSPPERESDELQVFRGDLVWRWHLLDRDTNKNQYCDGLTGQWKSN